MSGPELATIGILVLLLVLSAFFSATETAVFSSNKVRIRHLAEEGDRRAIITKKLLDQPSRLISTILVGNNAVNIGATALATVLAINTMGDKGAGIATAVMTVLVLVFGEITPKTLAARNPERFALKASRFIQIMGIIISPLIRVINIFTNVFVKILGGKQPENPLVTEEEIRMLVNVGQEEGLIDPVEREMIDSIFEFTDTLVHEIMVPRIDVVAVNVNEDIDNVINVIIEAGHSRIPVYEQTVDNIIGVIYAKDLLRPPRGLPDGMPGIKKMMRPAYYVPESKKVMDLFAEMRKAKVHMAIVLDEYGGTAGIATIEDVIEEIVGDIQDEFDREEESIKILSDGSMLVDARTPISDVNEMYGLDLPDDEYDTISGLVFHTLGTLPDEGRELDIGDLHVVVEKVEGRRMIKLRLNMKEDDQ